MSSIERHSAADLELPDPADLASLRRIRKFAGNYYRVLGWIDFISSVIALGIFYWTGHLAITFGFILYFWLGRRLDLGSPSARKWALISTFVIAALLIAGMLFTAMGLRLAPWGIGHDHPAFLFLAAATLIFLSIPAMFLLGESGRRAFMTQRGELDKDDHAKPAL